MRSSILVVDDQAINREILHELFRENYDIIEARDGSEAIYEIAKISKGVEISAILLDIIMPNVDGFAVMEYMRKKGLFETVPVILITGDTSTEIQNRGYDMGACEIINKPFDSCVVQKRVQNIIDLYYEKNHLKEMVDIQTKRIREQNGKIERMSYHIIDMIGSIVEFRSVETGKHIYRVRSFTKALLNAFADMYRNYGLTEMMINNIAYASALHDVGKIAIPDCVLLKPGKLTEAEFEVMKTHTTKGGELVTRLFDEDSDADYRKFAYDIARSHHEKYDGKGYPDGLKGDEIPIWAQVVSVVDCYDSLISDRVYKKAYSKDTAFQMILNGECGMFSPNIIACFKIERPELERIADEIK